MPSCPEGLSCANSKGRTRPPRRARPMKPWLCRSGGLEIHCRRLAALVVLDLVGQSLVGLERGHARALDRADVDEAVISAAFGRNEPIAFVDIEEFDLADGHGMFLSRNMELSERQCARSQEARKGRVGPEASFPSQATIAIAIWGAGRGLQCAFNSSARRSAYGPGSRRQSRSRGSR